MWRRDEKQTMLADYERAHLSRCPLDRALLTVIDLTTQRPPDEGHHGVLRITCPTCGRTFDSDEIESPEDPPGV